VIVSALQCASGDGDEGNLRKSNRTRVAGALMGAVRLFLALVVAAGHWHTWGLAPRHISFTDVWQLRFNAGYAVMFFYVISGFLITYTLSQNYSPDRAGLWRFYRNRTGRIFSAYWPVVLIVFASVPGSWDAFADKTLADKLTSLLLIGADWRLAFASYPEPHWSALFRGAPQAWTLGAELTFYLMVPLLMRVRWLGATILIASLTMRYALMPPGGVLDEVWTYQFFGSTVCFFMMGHLAAVVGDRWSAMRDRRIGFLLLGASAVAMFTLPIWGFDNLRFWLSITLFTLALPDLFDATCRVRWMNRLGDLSYPLYLVHTLVFLWFAVGLTDILITRLGAASIAVFLSASLAVAYGVHVIIERPLATRWRDSRVSAMAPAPA
jgi:peptidoglycan/LPS O-acetylase OafA/YrhL